MSHKQIFTKVNVRVDKGVEGIVSALSNFPMLETFESCEGDSFEGPWIVFDYGNSPKELSDFVLDFLAPQLYELVSDDVSITIQTSTSPIHAFGEICVRAGVSSRVEDAIWKISHNFNRSMENIDSFSVYRQNDLECSCDISDKDT